jgi:hypothetical protein
MNVTLYDAAGGGALLLIEEMQNSRFIGLNLMNGRGDHLVMDRGCAGNHFFGFESSNAGATAGVHLRLQATAAAPVGLVAYPFNNHFWSGIFERLDAGGTGIVHAGSGHYNHLHSVQLSLTGKTVPMVKVEITDPTHTPFVSLVLDNVHINDNSNLATALDVDDAADIDVLGRLVIQNTEYAYRLRDTSSRINFRGGAPEYNSVTTRLDPASVGTINGVTIHPMSTNTQYVLQGASDVILQALVAGEAGERLRIQPGLISFNDGSDFTPHATIGVGSSDQITVGAGDALRTGAIAALPAASATWRGYLYRVEGGAGVADALYVCEKNAGDAYVWRAI